MFVFDAVVVGADWEGTVAARGEPPPASSCPSQGRGLMASSLIIDSIGGIRCFDGFKVWMKGGRGRRGGGGSRVVDPHFHTDRGGIALELPGYCSDIGARLH